MNLQRTQANDISSTKFNDCSNDISFTKFNDMFKNKNLSLFTSKEINASCVCYSVGNLSTDVYYLQQERKDKARLDESFVFTVDLQAVLMTPKSEFSSLYYRREL